MIGGPAPRTGVSRGMVGLALVLGRVKLEGDAENDG